MRDMCCDLSEGNFPHTRPHRKCKGRSWCSHESLYLCLFRHRPTRKCEICRNVDRHAVSIGITRLCGVIQSSVHRGKGHSGTIPIGRTCQWRVRMIGQRARQPLYMGVVRATRSNVAWKYRCSMFFPRKVSAPSRGKRIVYKTD